MTQDSKVSSVSFPVTVWYECDTGMIHMCRRTDPSFSISIGPGRDEGLGSMELYRTLATVLKAGGAYAKADICKGVN